MSSRRSGSARGAAQGSAKRQRTHGGRGEVEINENEDEVDASVEEQLSLEAVKLNETVADSCQWFENGDQEEEKALAFPVLRNVTEEVQKQIQQHSGKKIIYIGKNGVGKSFILNLLLMLTVISPFEYKKSNSNAQLEDPDTEFVPDDFIADEDDSDFADLRSNLEGYSNGDVFSPSSFKEFLLPSRARLRSTTRTLIHILFRPIFRCVVAYLDETEIKRNAWEWVVLNQEVCDGQKANGDLETDNATKLREFFEKVVDPCQHFAPKSDEWQLLDSQDDLQLHPRVAAKAGQKRSFAGRGRSFHADRQWIRKKVEEVATDENDAIIQASVRLYVPCKIVADRGMITDSPGCDTSDPFLIEELRRGLNEHDVAVAVVRRNIEDEKSTINALKDSSFIDKLINFPRTTKLAVVHYPEPNCDMTRREAILEGKLDDQERDQAQAQAETKKVLRKLFVQFCPEAQDKADAAIDNVDVLTVWPTLFCSMEFNMAFRVSFSEAYGPDALDRVVQFTRTAELLGMTEYLSRQARLTAVDKLDRELEQAIETARDPPQTMTSMISDEVRDAVNRNVAHAVPPYVKPNDKNNKRKRLSEPAKLLHEQFVSEIDKLLQKKRDELIEMVQNVVDEGSHAVGGAFKRFEECVDRAVRAWDQLELTDANKLSGLSSKWAGSNRELKFKQKIFRSLHANNGIDFSDLISSIEAWLDTLVSALIDAAASQLSSQLFQSVRTDAYFQRELNRYFSAVVKPVLQSRMRTFFRFHTQKKHLTPDNLNGLLLVKAEDAAVREFLQNWFTKEQRQKPAATLKAEFRAEIPDLVRAVRTRLADEIGSVAEFQFKQLKLHLLAKARPARRNGLYSLLIYAFDFAAQLARTAGRTPQPEAMQKMAQELDGVRDQVQAQLQTLREASALDDVTRSTLLRMDSLRLSRDLELRFAQDLLKTPHRPPPVPHPRSRPPCHASEVLGCQISGDAERQRQLERRLRSEGLDLQPPLDTAVGSSSLFEAAVLQRYGARDDNEERALQLRQLLCVEVDRLRRERARAAFADAFRLHNRALPSAWQPLLESPLHVQRLSLQETPGDLLCVFVLAQLWSFGVDLWCCGRDQPFTVRTKQARGKHAKCAYRLAVFCGPEGLEFRSVCPRSPDAQSLPARELLGEAVPVQSSSHPSRYALPAPPQSEGPIQLIVDTEVLLAIASDRRRPKAMEAWRQLEDFHSSQLVLCIPQSVHTRIKTLESGGATGEQKRRAKDAKALLEHKFGNSAFWRPQTDSEAQHFIREYGPGIFDARARIIQWARHLNQHGLNAVVVTSDDDYANRCRNEHTPTIKPSGPPGQPGLLDLIAPLAEREPSVDRTRVDYAQLIRAHLRQNSAA